MTKNTRKMTRIEKKKQRELIKKTKSAKKIRNKLNTTLNWMDVQKVTEDAIFIAKDKQKFIIKGVKIHPHNIFLDDGVEKQQWVDSLRFCLNQIQTTCYFGFVYSPVNFDKQLNILDLNLMEEKDLTCQTMIRDDINKLSDFADAFREKEFFLMIRDHDEKRLGKDLQDLYVRLEQAGFLPTILNKRDYYSYLMHIFENTLVNDYVFGRGILSYLNTKMEYDAVKDEYAEVDSTENFAKYGDPILNIKDDANLIERSKIAPTSLKFSWNYMQIGDLYCNYLLCTSLPPVYNLAILTNYLNDSSVKVFMTLDKTDMNMSKILNRAYQEDLARLNRTKDETEKHRLMQGLETQQEYIRDVVRKNDVTFNTTLIFRVSANDLHVLHDKTKKLKDRLSVEGFKVVGGSGIQEALFRISCPLFINPKIDPIIQENFGVPMTSDGIAGLWPFIFETLDDTSGLLLGHELQNGGKILLDPFYYLHHPDHAKITNRVNGNFIIAGRAGSGKTTAMNLVVRNCIKNKTSIVWVDPENKNRKLTLHYKGTFIDWGKRGNIINPFDLKPISFDPDDDDPNINDKMWDTELAINNVIEDIKQIFSYLWSGITEDELSMVGKLVKITYAQIGLKPDENGKYPPFKGLKSDEMPTFTDFNEQINKSIERFNELWSKGQIMHGYEDDVKFLRSLSRKMSSIMNEWSVYLNGHTTIRTTDSERNIVSFGTKKLQQVSENLQNALYHIMFNYSWSLCLDDSYESAFIIDEAHTIILQGKISRLVSQFVRRSRKYRNVMLIATQEPRDFADDAVLTDGKAIFNNSVYKIILGLNKDATNDIKKLETINDSEEYLIQRFGQGDALLICGNRRIPIHIIATHEELAEMGAMFQ